MNRRKFIMISSTVVLGSGTSFIKDFNPMSNDYCLILYIHLRGGHDSFISLRPFLQSKIISNGRSNFQKDLHDRKVLKYHLSISQQAKLHSRLNNVTSLHEDRQLHLIPNVGYKKQINSHFEAEKLISQEVFNAITHQDSKYPYCLTFGHDNLLLNLQPVNLKTCLNTQITCASPILFLDNLPLIQNHQKKWADTLENALKKGHNQITYPQTVFAQELKTVAQLIQGGCTTRVYHVTLNGFDTHQNQAEQYSHLLNTFNDGIFAFQQDLNKSGQAKRVLTVAFSEFGRSVKENIWGGTEHGNHQTLMFFGENIGGVTGTHPDLSDLDDAGLIAKPPMFDLIDTLKNVTTNWLTEGVFSIESRNRGTSL